MRRLRQANVVLERQHAAATGRVTRQPRRIMTPDEVRAIESQQHLEYSHMAVEQQQKIDSELSAMWNQIPEHLREKAKDVRGWKERHGK